MIEFLILVMMFQVFIQYLLLSLTFGWLITAIIATKVCGTNLVTYQSTKSVLLLQTTGVKVGIIDFGSCEKVCLLRDPVCGSDARTYYNYCHLVFAQRRGETVTPRFAGHCGTGGEHVGPPGHPLRSRTKSIKEPYSFWWLPPAQQITDVLRKSTEKQNASLSFETNIKPNISLDAKIVFGGANQSYIMLIKDNKLEYTNSTYIQKRPKELQVDESHEQNPETITRKEKKKVEVKLPKKDFKRASKNKIKKVIKGKADASMDAIANNKDIIETKSVDKQGELINDVALDKLKLEVNIDIPKTIRSNLMNILRQLQE